MHALSASPVTLVPEPRKRAAVLVPFSGDVTADLKTRSVLVSAARAAGLDVASLIEAKANPKAARQQAVLAASNGVVEVLVVNTLADLGQDLFGAISTALAIWAVGGRILSTQQGWLGLDTELNLITSAFAWMVTEEKARKARAIRTGQERARARAPGVKVGRPKKVVDVQQALTLIASGLPIGKAAAKIGCSRSHLKRALLAHETTPAAVTDSPLARRVTTYTEGLGAVAT